MFIGRNNSISKRLVSEISNVFPMELMEFDLQIANKLKNALKQPEFVFVNLMDIDNSVDLPKLLNSQFPNSQLIAIHYFESQSVIDSTLKLGYDQYVSMFELDEKVLESLLYPSA